MAKSDDAKREYTRDYNRDYKRKPPVGPRFPVQRAGDQPARLASGAEL